jgi:hypothetical protein
MDIICRITPKVKAGMRLFALKHKHILHKTNPANHSHLEPKLHASRRQR